MVNNHDHAHESIKGGGDSGAKYWDIRGLDLKDCEPYYKRAVSVT